MYDLYNLRDSIALAAGLIMEWAEDRFGFGGAAGDPDPEQFAYLEEISKALNAIVDEQVLKDIY